jgi:hypothetical protein
MCTYYTLHYGCGHTQSSHRCPRSTSIHTNTNGGKAIYTRECDNKYYVRSDLATDCLDCKIANGLVPGVQTGLDVWANDKDGKDTTMRAETTQARAKIPESHTDHRKGEAFSPSTSLASVDPRLLDRGKPAPAGGAKLRGGSGGQQDHDAFEAKVKAVLAEQRAQSSSVDSGYGNSSSTAGRSQTPALQGSPSTIFDRMTLEEQKPRTPFSYPLIKDNSKRNQAEAPAKSTTEEEKEDDWMWGGMTCFEDKRV